MKTKIVYVVASLDDDIYMEQAIVSAWSARYYNPGCYIVMVCCQDTFATLEHGYRKEYKSLFNEIIVREFQSEQGMIERSRWMKTSLRNIVDGDLLYIDTDTVVCGSLECVDDFKMDLGFVLDNNCSFEHFIIRDKVIRLMKKIFNIDVSEEKKYFNSGVFYIKDTSVANRLFSLWNEHWIYAQKNFHEYKDQQPLMMANIEMNYPIEELSGDMNCQVVASVQYLYSAKIVHFYNNFLGKNSTLSPFFDKSTYNEIKKVGLSEKIKDLIVNCKSSFSSPSVLVSRDEMIWLRNLYVGSERYRSVAEKGYGEDFVYTTHSFNMLFTIFSRYPKLYCVIEKCLGGVSRFTKLFKKK